MVDVDSQHKYADVYGLNTFDQWLSPDRAAGQTDFT